MEEKRPLLLTAKSNVPSLPLNLTPWILFPGVSSFPSPLFWILLCPSYLLIVCNRSLSSVGWPGATTKAFARSPVAKEQC